MASAEDEAFNIDGNSFNSDLYLSKLLKEGNLKQIMEKECEIVRESQYLHSEMQTLVYENYNKFISATDTVRKMRKDFKNMQAEMERLNANMEKITQFSGTISDSLKDSRGAVDKLCETGQLLRKLQFLFLLPSRLNESIAKGLYSDAVSDYLHAQRVLERYGSQPSFQGIQKECEEIVNQLITLLKERLATHDATAAQLAESVCLLVQLQGSDEALNEKFLCSSEPRLLNHLETLKDTNNCSDLLEWVERGNSGLLADLCIVVSSYNEMFLATANSDSVIQNLNHFTENIMLKYLELAKVQFESNAIKSGTEILVRSLDKFYRRLQAINQQIHGNDYANEAADIVMTVILSKGQNYFNMIKAQFWERLVSIRQSIASKTSGDLKEMLSSLQVFIMEKVQASLQDLMIFLQSGLSFSFKPACVNCVVKACIDLVSDTITDLVSVVKGFCVLQATNNSTPAQLLLILSKLCYELQNSGINCLLSQGNTLLDKASHLAESVCIPDSLGINLCKHAGEGAQTLLDSYVNHVGLKVSQMLRVSVLSREWIRVPEPRGVRAVARRVLEALAAAEQDALQLYDSGTTTRQSSDSSRRTHSLSASKLPYRSNWSNGVLDSSLASNINKLFSEKIEIFSPVEPTKVSIMTGIVKISLKTFLECVRLRTYSRYGLQQMQVDIHYLQLYLWQYVHDENLVHILLDEVLGSVINRCIDPRLMEPSVVEIICERG
ncbi:vacuolar protein sorting 51 [Arctopsyche grandis]|uniref:vacuolar protein sorting 51 n=1 Tax=Arctopsyche grandis TaxID=121162 RepID=UPI00406D711F